MQIKSEPRIEIIYIMNKKDDKTVKGLSSEGSWVST